MGVQLLPFPPFLGFLAGGMRDKKRSDRKRHLEDKKKDRNAE